MNEKYEFIEFIRKLEDYRITIDPNHTEMLQLNKVIYKLLYSKKKTSVH